jgi:hypothetical protein
MLFFSFQSPSFFIFVQMPAMTRLSAPINILPLSGLELLPFGKTQQDGLHLLGLPDKEQLFEEPLLATKHLVLHYQEADLSLYFDLHAEGRLCSFECGNRLALLCGQPIFQLDEKALSAYMKSLGYPLSETEQTTWGEKRLGFDEAGIDAFFEKKRGSAERQGRKHNQNHKPLVSGAVQNLLHETVIPFAKFIENIFMVNFLNFKMPSPSKAKSELTVPSKRKLLVIEESLVPELTKKPNKENTASSESAAWNL